MRPPDIRVPISAWLVAVEVEHVADQIPGWPLCLFLLIVIASLTVRWITLGGGVRQ